jgi:hypothetical protein
MDKIFSGYAKAQFSANPGYSPANAARFCDFNLRKSILRRRNGDFMG